MPDTPLHLALPLRLRGGRMACHEQDSDEEIDTNVLVAISYPPGYLDCDPEFGAKPSPFRQNGVNLDVLAARIQLFEDRATVDNITRVPGLREYVQLDPTP